MKSLTKTAKCPPLLMSFTKKTET